VAQIALIIRDGTGYELVKYVDPPTAGFMLAQQNNHMEALERRRERDRAAAATAAQQGPVGLFSSPSF
jgi:hypothetical protein